MLETRITASEWEVMRVVWANQQTTSKYISEVLEKKMDWKTATTKTLIGRLVKKNKLMATEEGRKYLYSPKVTEQECMQQLSREVLYQVCPKKRGDVLYQMLEDTTISCSEIEKLIELLENKQKTAPKVVACTCTPGQCNCQLEH